MRTCAVDSYRESFANLLHAARDVRFGSRAQISSPSLAPAEGVPDPADVERYAALLQRRATPYRVDDRARALPSSYPESAVGADAVDGPRDDGARSREVRSRVEAGNSARAAERSSTRGARRARTACRCRTASGGSCRRYNGEKVVWQFGMAENASSSLMITLPARGLTLILMANSDGLVKLYSPANGDVTLSPFARLVLERVRPVMRTRWLALALWLLAGAGRSRMAGAAVHRVFVRGSDDVR